MGTYNVVTGVYTSSTGVKTSTATPPSSATIIFTPDTTSGTFVSSSSSSSGGGSSSTATTTPTTTTTSTPTTTPIIQPSSSTPILKVIPQSTISANRRIREGRIAEFTRLPQLNVNLRAYRLKQRTKLERGKKLKPLEAVGLYSATLGGVITETTSALIQTPKLAFNIARNPRILKEFPSLIKKGGKDFGRMLKVSPTEALIKAGGEILVLKGTTKVISSTSKLTSNTLTRLSPKFVGTAKAGRTLKIGKGNFKVVSRIPTQSIKKQVELAGKRINAISSQGDSLLKILKRTRTIRKPIPNEASFTKKLQAQLKRFDAGKLSKREIINLNTNLKKVSKGLLERNFFASPEGSIRPSRLGVLKNEKGLNLKDYLTGDISFKKAKPQILYFENIKVQKFPKSLSNVVKKLKAKKPLTSKETADLLSFQLKKSGKFKPLGFLSRESEIVLSPNEIIKRVKKVGVTIANGKRIPIVQAKVVKPTKLTKELLTKFKKGKLNSAQTKKLNAKLLKETGLNYGLTNSYNKVGRVVIDMKKVGLATFTSTTKKAGSSIREGIGKIRKKKTSTKTKIRRITPRKKPVIRSKKVSKKILLSTKRPSPPKPPKVFIPPKPPKPSKSGGSSPRKIIKSPPRYIPKSPPKSSPPRSPPSKPRPRSPPRSPPSSPPRYIPKSPPKSPAYPLSPVSPRKPLPPRLPVPYAFFNGKKRKITKIPKGFVLAYNVYGKTGKKFYKLNKKPLKKVDSLSRGTYAIDRTTSKQFKMIPVGYYRIKDLGKALKRERGYFLKTKPKFREYKIKKGKRKYTEYKYIEKKKYFKDKEGEKKNKSLRKYKK